MGALHWSATTPDLDEDQPDDANTTDGSFKHTVNHFFNTLSLSPTEDDFQVTYCDICMLFVSILGRITAILANIYLAYDYFRHGYIDYFSWTVSCICIPLLVTTVLQVAFYFEDLRTTKTARKSNFCDIFWFIIIIPYLFRYCQSLSYSIASKQAGRANKKRMQKKYYELLIHEDSDVALIRIFECFLESAPQKILQISILLAGYDSVSIPQAVSILTSLLNMAWCIASYHRCIRWSQVDKMKISWLGTIVQWLCHFLISVSRVLSIAIVASLFPRWTLVACAVHATCMALWIFLFDKSPFCSRSFVHSFAFSLILGAVFIFNYILPKVRRTRYRYTIFYSICFLENCACVALFVEYSKPATIAFRYVHTLCVLSIVPFALGVGCMIVYYTRFHPNIIIRRQTPVTTAVVITQTDVVATS